MTAWWCWRWWWFAVIWTCSGWRSIGDACFCEISNVRNASSRHAVRSDLVWQCNVRWWTEMAGWTEWTQQVMYLLIVSFSRLMENVTAGLRSLWVPDTAVLGPSQCYHKFCGSVCTGAAEIINELSYCMMALIKQVHRVFKEMSAIKYYTAYLTRNWAIC